MKKLKKKKVLFGALLVLITWLCTAAAVNAEPAYAEETPDTVQIRILSTGDIHGQATAYNYETNRADPLAGLSKVATLINEAKGERPVNNSILIDAGDFLYDYSTNFFYNKMPDTIQPILQIMDSIGYDCLTLGNHEFDYPWDYLKRQLTGSNLWDKTIVCNLYSADTMERVFAPSMVITKYAKSAKGETVEVRIGIVGATRQALSTRREYYGFFTGKDIYSSVSAEAKRLRTEEDVDLVVALIHGGIGALSGSNTTTHPGARLAKLTSVDAVITSHSHELFPAKNGAYSDAAYANTVDEQNGLVYGTPVVGAGGHASALGIIDLNLIVNKDGSFSVDSASADARTVSNKIGEMKLYKNIYAPYLAKMTSQIDLAEYPIAEGQTYTNLDCFIQDNDLYQLYNNAKLQYANTYIRENLPEYKDIPVIASTTNILDNNERDIIITDAFTETKVSEIISENSIVRDSGYLHMFKITGYKLREWLEYNASIYATAGLYTFETLLPNYFAKSPNVMPLLQSAYNENHSNFTVFDGISYEIDISQNARYYANGKMISSLNKRIKSLTYNGKEIANDQVFIIVTDAFAVRYSFMPEDSESIYKVHPWKNGKDVFIEYLKQLSLSGPIKVKADNNWKIIAPTGYKFAVTMPKGVTDILKTQKWYSSYAATYKASVYPIFFSGTFKKTSVLPQGLNVILAASTTKSTGNPVEISVIVTKDATAGIAEIRYLEGNYKSKTNEKWKTAPLVENKKFSVTKNKTYTVLVTDTLDNKSLSTITVSNYKKSVVDAPVCSSFSNRMNTITGTASPNITVTAMLPDGSLCSAISDKTGAFSISVPHQRAFDYISVYAEKDGTKSNIISVLVRRTGPNQPVVTSDISVPTKVFEGTVDPNTTVFLRYGKAIYINYGESKIYQACDFFNSGYTVTETNITVDENGVFYATSKSNIPMGKTIWVYAVDKNNKTSKGYSIVIGSGGIVTDPAPDTDPSIETELPPETESSLEIESPSVTESPLDVDSLENTTATDIEDITDISD